MAATIAGRGADGGLPTAVGGCQAELAECEEEVFTAEQVAQLDKILEAEAAAGRVPELVPMEARGAQATMGAGEPCSVVDIDATRAAILAAVTAARKAHTDVVRAAAVEAKRAAVMAAVAAAKGADARRVTTKDLFGMEKVEGSDDPRNLAREEVKEYRMQGNYGATKFIKP